MLAVLLFLVACIELAWAVVVLRADWRRWDNRVFAAIGALDAMMAATRAVFVARGYHMSDVALFRFCGMFSVGLAILTVEFTSSFPFSRPAPWRARLPLLLYSAAASLLILHPALWGQVKLLTFLYFLPMFGLTVLLLSRNLRRLDGRSALSVRLVLAAIVVRWVFSICAYGVAKEVSAAAFESALVAESTLSVLVASILIGYAVLSGQLFRVRGVVAEMSVHAMVVLAVAATVVAGIEAALALPAGAIGTRIILFWVALLPLVIVVGVRRMRHRIEARLDPRRAMRATIVSRILHDKSADPEALITGTCAAFAQVSAGGSVRFLSEPGLRVPGAGGELSAELAARLRDEDHVVGEQTLHVAVRSGNTLQGALELAGGQLDRDTLLAATALANHLGVKLENMALFAELEESRRLATLGSFAAAIAHDIRTPLASVQMNVQMLRRKVSLPADDMEHFDIALEELRRLNASISELLDYAKPVRLAEAALELREVADDAARGVAPIFAERGVTLAVELSEGLPPVRADALRLRQVLLNLLDNAAKASAKGTAVKLRGSAADDGRVAFEIADEGRGIEPGDLARIFEPFYTTRPDGTGLGLAIVQKLVKAHRGEVVVRSTPGKGSTFTVLLPAAT